MSSMFGELEITSIDRNGNRFAFKTPNTITLAAARVAAHVLVADDISNLKVSKLGVGTGTTAPVRANTALESQVHSFDIQEILYPNPGQLEFVATLDFLTPANGSNLTEAGLYTADGSHLFARQVYSAVHKTDDIRLEYRWRIVFT